MGARETGNAAVLNAPVRESAAHGVVARQGCTSFASCVYEGSNPSDSTKYTCGCDVRAACDVANVVVRVRFPPVALHCSVVQRQHVGLISRSRGFDSLLSDDAPVVLTVEHSLRTAEDGVRFLAGAPPAPSSSGQSTRLISGRYEVQALGRRRNETHDGRERLRSGFLPRTVRVRAPGRARMMGCGLTA